MRFTHRATIVTTVAIAGLAAVATTTAAAASPAQSTVHGGTRCIKVTATIPVGIGPFGVAVDPKTKTIYVANTFASPGTVSVISGRTNTVIATIPVGIAPLGVAANPKTNTAYVANEVSGTVSVLASCR